MGAMGSAHSKYLPRFVPVTKMPQMGSGRGPTAVSVMTSTLELHVFRRALERQWPATAEAAAPRHKLDPHAPVTLDSVAMPVSSLRAPPVIQGTLVPLVPKCAHQQPSLVRLPTPARGTVLVVRVRLVVVRVCAKADTLVRIAPLDARPPAPPFHVLETAFVT